MWTIPVITPRFEIRRAISASGAWSEFGQPRFARFVALDTIAARQPGQQPPFFVSQIDRDEEV
jgi:hypothetical protein